MLPGLSGGMQGATGSAGFSLRGYRYTPTDVAYYPTGIQAGDIILACIRCDVLGHRVSEPFILLAERQESSYEHAMLAAVATGDETGYRRFYPSSYRAVHWLYVLRGPQPFTKITKAIGKSEYITTTPGVMSLPTHTTGVAPFATFMFMAGNMPDLNNVYMTPRMFDGRAALMGNFGMAGWRLASERTSMPSEFIMPVDDYAYTGLGAIANLET